MSRLRAISLFSNCGAGDLGYRKAGFSFDVMAELDPRRLEVGLKNHPGAIGVPGDLRTTWPKVVRAYQKKAGKNRRPALLCACPPCQGLSSVRSDRGNHDDADAGSRDERNLLVTVIAKVANRLKPSLVVVENVPAFLTRKVRHPRDAKPVSAANYLITELAKDYVVFPFIADLCEFGVPQTRSRAFLTFVRRDVAGLRMLMRLAHAPYPRPTRLFSNSARKPINLTAALTKFALPDLDALTEEGAAVDGYRGFHCVPVWDERTYAMVAAIRPGSGASAWDNKVCAQCGRVPVKVSSAVCPTCGEALLRPIVKARNGRFRLVRGFASSYRRMYGDRPAATVTTASGHIGSDYTIHPTQNRLLSVLECALLQTFPRNFVWGDALDKWGHTNIREMIGEAVPPGFTRLHGEVLKSVLGKKSARMRIGCGDDRLAKAWVKLIDAAKKDRRRNPRKSVPAEFFTLPSAVGTKAARMSRARIRTYGNGRKSRLRQEAR